MSENTEGNTMTSVKTIYARAAVLLLALNFCLTGYVVTQMGKATQEQIDGATEAQATSSKASQRLSQGAQTESQNDGDAAGIKTRERE